MPEPEMIPLDPDSEFQFGCHCDVPCFNQCCRDLNQALTPYDVLRLKQGLRMDTEAFFSRYAMLYTGPGTGLPVASLRFSDHADRGCPFVSPEGCRVYLHRPCSCRLYPLARALTRRRSDGRTSEHYALLREPHCRGFDQQRRQSVRQWITDQELAVYLAQNDDLMELIALKNQLRPGPLSAEHQRWTQLALYDPERLVPEARAGTLPGMDLVGQPPRSDATDDPAWLQWGFAWIRRLLFGKAGSPPPAGGEIRSRPQSP